jgi:hypothetical protein
MRHGLFPQNDISERNSTESRSDLSFEGVCPGVNPGGNASEPIAECIARLEETAFQTLKDQITATGLNRYRFGGMVRASSHIQTIEFSSKNPEY